MSLDIRQYMEGHRNGVFYGLLLGAAFPFRNAAVAAKDLCEAAQHVTLQDRDIEQMQKHAAELEAAAQGLRAAASPAKPALRLVAAE